MKPFVCMYVCMHACMHACIGVCEEVRPDLGGSGQTKRTALDRRRSKGGGNDGGSKGMGLGTSSIPSSLISLIFLQYLQNLT
ncbi:hypothetical protein Hanom_Chr04g00289181 [Helianthus anomalus]